MKIYYLVCFLILYPFFGYSQNSIDTTSYEYHIKLGQEYNLAYKFPESIKQIEIAIDIAKKEFNLEKQLNAEISLAELMRRTQNYRTGLTILYGQKKYAQFPKIHVRRLGRMAALYSEGASLSETFLNKVNVVDSVGAFLKEALFISVKNHFQEEEASLRNELGLFLMRRKKREESIPHLKKAAELYMKFGDTVNYIRPMMRLMENSMMLSNNMQRFDAIADTLLSLTNGKEWYSLEAELYKFVGSGRLHRDDSLGYYKWLLRSEKSSAEFNKLVHSDKLASIEARFETERYKKEAVESKLESSQKTKQLKQKSLERRQLVYLLIVLVLVLFGTVFFIIRERKTKRKVNQINTNLLLSNEKYELLMVESNHRIKNNLQMIISLLEYSSEDVIENGEKALKRISTKIETIGALHNHLNENVHFEKVRVDRFFDEILGLYQNISASQFKITKDFLPLEIKNERIIYLGLILNELLSNTIEHNESDINHVKIEVLQSNKRYVFRYCDNSPQKETDLQGTGSILIKKLIRRVGGIDFQINKERGLYEFKFNG
jgi:two-component sensor histidine kinase